MLTNGVQSIVFIPFKTVSDRVTALATPNISSPLFVAFNLQVPGFSGVTSKSVTEQTSGDVLITSVTPPVSVTSSV